MDAFGQPPSQNIVDHRVFDYPFLLFEKCLPERTHTTKR